MQRGFKVSIDLYIFCVLPIITTFSHSFYFDDIYLDWTTS